MTKSVLFYGPNLVRVAAYLVESPTIQPSLAVVVRPERAGRLPPTTERTQSDPEMKTKHTRDKSLFRSWAMMAVAALTLFLGAAGNSWA
ncbi:MAG: hypothetical protein JF617_20475, partial [Burkholderiales bacterium]|nr:hypothetical protein [Burkholderiales bacterium]